MKRILLIVLVGVGLALPRASGQAPAPAVTLDLGTRQGQGQPHCAGFTHTGGGNIDVSQPSPDTVVVTVTGVAVAGGHPCKDSLAALTFDVCQEFEVTFAKPEVNKAKLTLDARVIGLLRSHKCGGGAAAINCPAHAAVVAGEVTLFSVNLPGRSVAGGDNLSVNDRQGPVAVPVQAGHCTLRVEFSIQATHPKSLLPCKAASAEFAPDPALDPLWISFWEPFHGASKKDFGFQVILKVAPDGGTMSP
jgi:hypothetical protein